MDKENYEKLYTGTDKALMKVAEDSLNPRTDRVEELIAFAMEAGYTRIGIANCTVFEKEAEMLENDLKSRGLEVFRANCKLGRVPFHDILPGYKGISCNPAGQAELMNRNKTQLNVVMGLCLGHDMVFNRNSKAPVTTLLVKDRRLKHKTVEHFTEKTP